MQAITKKSKVVYTTEEFSALKQEISEAGGTVEHTHGMQNGRGISVIYNIPKAVPAEK